MHSTPLSLLKRLTEGTPDSSDWDRLTQIYSPLLDRWIRQIPGVNSSDVPDITQEVFLVVVQELPAFRRRREGSLRAWLKSVLTNRVRAYWRERRRQPLPVDADVFLSDLIDPLAALSNQWAQDHDREVVDQLFRYVRVDFSEETWAAFCAVTVAQEPAAEVAAKLKMSKNAVFCAVNRVVGRLRSEAEGWIE